jgi:cytochrome c oxidase assembly protein subunit 15
MPKNSACGHSGDQMLPENVIGRNAQAGGQPDMSQADAMNFGPGRLPRHAHNWLHRYAIVLAVLTFVLIVAGANVTSKNAGLAVPDWPLSFGSVDPAGWTHEPLVRDEHGHRLIGATVGLLVIGLLIWMQFAEPRRWVRRLGYAAMVGVVAQGVLGGLRVLLAHKGIDTETSITFAIVHGCVAQAFFCLAIAIALATSPRYPGGAPITAASATDAARNRALRKWTTVLIACVYGQLVLGAVLRHKMGSTHAVGTHIAGALVVGFCLILVVQHVFSRPQSQGPLAGPAIAAFLLYGFQILLGVTAYVLLMPLSQRKAMTLTQTYVPTLHVALGALILGLSFLIAFRAFALTAGRPQGAIGGSPHTALGPKEVRA